MKLKYLGTAAAEGFPALFCNCEYCNEARALGGKNVRTRSQSMINGDMFIDFPPDTYHHILQNNIRGDEIKYLLITHAHPDHFYIRDFYNRGGAYARNMTVPVLKVFCPSTVYKAFENIPRNVEITELRAFETVEIGEYRVTPLPARHASGTDAFIYMIKSDKTILYAHDTGYFYEEVFAYIEKNNIVFDMISLDCTNVDIPISDEGAHMGFANIERVLSRLCAIGAINDSTIKYVNHFSHNGRPIHHIMEERAAEYGCLVSYDGCEVII